MTLPVLLLSVYVCVCVCMHTHNSNTHTHKYTCVTHVYTHIPSKPNRSHLPLQSNRRFKAVSEANQTVSRHNCIDRISAEFGWQEGCIHIYTHTHIYNTHTHIYAIHMKYTYICGQRCLASHKWNAWGCKRVGCDSVTKKQQQ